MIEWIPYCGAAPLPGELAVRWNFDPWLMLAIALFTAWRLRVNRGSPRRSGLVLLATGLCVFLFISPFCALTSALFSVRVVHHLALSLLLAPLLAELLPAPRRLPIGLVTATAAQAVIFWVWHAPPVYGWALSSDAAYWLMQISLTASAVLFWMVLRAARPMEGVLPLLISMVLMGLLGAILTFSTLPLYAPHFTAPLAWGMPPLEDQQLGGLLMWVPGSAGYLLAALIQVSRAMEGRARDARA